ncbi:MAG: MotA/TolQ/ExbB proton channel family protein [Bdellovibrionota bacterium]|nr:MotA/TolQ/ExbB proton channel family protein [Bdellovibrionota bacterium]
MKKQSLRMGSLLKKHYFKALVLASGYQLFVSIIFYSLSDKESLFGRTLMLLGGNFFTGGFFQGLIVFSTLWAFFDIRKQRKVVRAELSGLSLGLLSTKDKHVLLPMDLPQVEERIAALKDSRKRLLVARVLLSALTKFKATHSMGETIDVINIQSDLQKEIHEASQSNIRYLLWLIPSLGFMGTVVGLSQSLGVAHEGDMKLISTSLGLAFDTTLIALILSALITGLYHRLQEEMDTLHASLKEYIVSHFVNKLEIKTFLSDNR